jgi:hypothetical protein
MDYRNGLQLRLFECIESIKSDVKKKMMPADACDPYTKVTRESGGRNFFVKSCGDHRSSRKKAVHWSVIVESLWPPGLCSGCARGGLVLQLFPSFLRHAHL